MIKCLAENPELAAAANSALDHFSGLTSCEGKSIAEIIEEEILASCASCGSGGGGEAAANELVEMLEGETWIDLENNPISQFTFSEDEPFSTCNPTNLPVECESCTEGQKQELELALNTAIEMLECVDEILGSCLEYPFTNDFPCNAHKSNFQSIFGTDDPTAVQAARMLYKFIYSVSDGDSYQVQPNGEGNCALNTNAWSFPAVQVTSIRLCDPNFFNQTSNQQAETLIHEWFHLHYVAGDIAYSHQPGFLDLSTLAAFFNADSFSTFAQSACN